MALNSRDHSQKAQDSRAENENPSNAYSDPQQNTIDSKIEKINSTNLRPQSEIGEDDEELAMDADDEDNNVIETERAIKPSIYRTQDI